MRPSARSFILDLLSTLKQGSMPVRALVAAGACFDIAENSIRVALARLLAARRVERDERGRYRLGSAADPVRRHVVSWRSLSKRTRAWDGSWVGVYTAPLASPVATRTTGNRALRFLGFRTLGPGLEIRPDNLRGGVSSLREELHSFGLDPAAPVFGIRGLDPLHEARARDLWDARSLRAAYRSRRGELEESAERLPGLSEEEAMVESFLLGGRAIRQLVLDPLLPEPIIPDDARDALVDVLRQYDRLGRACWVRFLDRYDVPHLRTPADTRIAAGVEKLAATA